MKFHNEWLFLISTNLNNKPTRRNNVLDLVLTNVPNLVNIHEVLSPTEAEVFTNHNIILFDVLILYLQNLQWIWIEQYSTTNVAISIL
jgi:hypothetical protein